MLIEYDYYYNRQANCYGENRSGIIEYPIQNVIGKYIGEIEEAIREYYDKKLGCKSQHPMILYILGNLLRTETSFIIKNMIFSKSEFDKIKFKELGIERYCKVSENLYQSSDKLNLYILKDEDYEEAKRFIDLENDSESIREMNINSLHRGLRAVLYKYESERIRLSKNSPEYRISIDHENNIARFRMK